MAAKTKVVGPYKVKNIGGDVWEVVEIVDAQGNYSELRPRYTTLHRSNAFAKALRLNTRWNEDHELEENYEELIKRF